MQIITVGLDLAKSIFQVHGVDAAGAAHLKRKLRRAEVIPFFSRLDPCIIGMEACATAHHWARELAELGHDVRLMPPTYVKAYVRRQKNDMADAAAICEAVARPSMRFVPVKSRNQQATLVAHRGRTLLVRQRTALYNAIRSHCAEFGLSRPYGTFHVQALVAVIMDDADPTLPTEARPALKIMVEQLRALDANVKAMEAEAVAARKVDERVKRLLTIPGIGPIGATAIAATVPDANAFKSGREFAAWLGLVPRQSSSGGKERLGSHTKMGDIYIRHLLVVGAQAVIRQAVRKPGVERTWLGQLLARKYRTVAAVAYANKIARIAWAIMARGGVYRAGPNLVGEPG